MNDLLAEHFRDVVDLAFTASMEGKLDRVAEGDRDWVGVVRDFYGPFAIELEEAERKLPKLEVKDEPTDEICPTCGRPMVIKNGRFGKFISCTGYPECKTTRPILKDTGAICPKDGGMIVERKSRAGARSSVVRTIRRATSSRGTASSPSRCPACDRYVVAKNRRGGVVVLECAADKEHDVTGSRAIRTRATTWRSNPTANASRR